MNENDARIEQFKSDIEGMKLKGGSGESERWMLVVGTVLALAGVALAVLGAVQVGNYGGDPANQRAYMAQGSFLGLALIIVGAALFVRFSMGRYLRFWLVRLTYESRANTDRIVDAIERASGIEPTGSSAAGVTEAPQPRMVEPPAPVPAPATPPPFPGTTPG